jgi:hypothetical protein
MSGFPSPPPRLLAGHAAAWADVRERGEFTYRDVCSAAGVSYTAAFRLVAEWERVGAVELVRNEGRIRVFAVRDAAAFDALQGAAEEPRAPSRGQSPERNMWTAIRTLANFSARDVAIHGSTETVRLSESEAQAYCRALLRFGYLRVVRKAVPGRSPATYRLIRNTGPQAPRLRRVTGLQDPNTGAFLHAEGGA